MHAFTILPSRVLVCWKLVKLTWIWNSFQRDCNICLNVTKKINFRSQDYIQGISLIRIWVCAFQCKHILKSSKQQVFYPRNTPLCNCPFSVMWIHHSSLTAKLTTIQPSKCQQHCNSFSLWPRDAPHSPDPDYTWSKMSSSTIWLHIWAWIEWTRLCSSEMTNWIKF